MDQLVTSTATGGHRTTTATDTLDRLTFLGWKMGLAAIVAGMAASFFLFGYAVIYWRNADMDLVVVYNALLMNDGRPQQFFGHPGYFTILSLKVWFQFLHGLGLLDPYSLSAIPSAVNVAAFDNAMTSAVRAGRILALLLATGCVLIFASLVRLVVRDWRIALLATFAFAFSGGVTVHSRILRTEFVAACPVMIAFLILIVVGRRATIARPLGLAIAAGLCVLGLENKVHAILLITMLPLLILPFGNGKSASVKFWDDNGSSWLAVCIAAIVAVAAAWAASPLIQTGFGRALLDAADFRPLLFGHFGIYQAALLVVVAGCTFAYAAIWHVSVAETLASIFAMIAGASIALLALNIEYNAENVIAVVNPLEKMLTFADANTSDVAHGSNLSAIFLLLLDGLGSVLARYTFVLHPSPRPAVFLTWLIVPGIVYAWRQDERQTAVQAMVLLMAAIAIDTVGVRRNLKAEYFIFTDPLIILAGALLLDRFSNLRFHKWAYPIGLSLFGLHLAIGQAEPVKHALKRTGPESVCEWNTYYLPSLPLPWCKVPPD